MVSIKIVIACGMWLLPAAVLTARRGVTPAYLAALSAAAAATAAVAADELTARRGDQVTDSCLAALEIRDTVAPCPCRQAATLRAERPLRSVLPGRDVA